MARSRPGTRTLNPVCFNLTFESEEDLAAIAAGMSEDADRGIYAPADASDGPVGPSAR